MIRVRFSIKFRHLEMDEADLTLIRDFVFNEQSFLTDIFNAEDHLKLLLLFFSRTS